MNIKLLIFDFDGTLADTQRTIVAAKQETMRRMNLTVADEAACIATIGLSSKSGFNQTNPGLSEEELDKCVMLYRQLFDEMKVTMPPVLFKNVDKVLRTCAERHITCTIASSRNTASLEDFIKGWGLTEYFPYMLGAEATEHLKPHPEPVWKTLEELSFDAKEALVIGDMPVDIEMGRHAGAYTCGVTYGNSTREALLAAGADYVIDDIAELLEII